MDCYSHLLETGVEAFGSSWKEMEWSEAALRTSSLPEEATRHLCHCRDCGSGFQPHLLSRWKCLKLWHWRLLLPSCKCTWLSSSWTSRLLCTRTRLFSSLHSNYRSLSGQPFLSPDSAFSKCQYVLMVKTTTNIFLFCLKWGFLLSPWSIAKGNLPECFYSYIA